MTCVTWVETSASNTSTTSGTAVYAELRPARVTGEAYKIVYRLGPNWSEIEALFDPELDRMIANAEASRHHRPPPMCHRQSFRARHGHQELARLPCYRGVRKR